MRQTAFYDGVAERDSLIQHEPFRSNDAVADAFADTFDAHFGVVYDLASRVTDSEREAANITRDAFGRVVAGDDVRAHPDNGNGGRIVANAYHEAATQNPRPTQPVGAGTHTLPDDVVAVVNSHVARCRTCRRWGSLPLSGQPTRSPAYPEAMQTIVWAEVADLAEAHANDESAHRQPLQPVVAMRQVWRAAWPRPLIAVVGGLAALGVVTAIVVALMGGDSDDGTPSDGILTAGGFAAPRESGDTPVISDGEGTDSEIGGDGAPASDAQTDGSSIGDDAAGGENDDGGASGTTPGDGGANGGGSGAAPGGTSPQGAGDPAGGPVTDDDAAPAGGEASPVAGSPQPQATQPPVVSTPLPPTSTPQPAATATPAAPPPTTVPPADPQDEPLVPLIPTAISVVDDLLPLDD